MKVPLTDSGEISPARRELGFSPESRRRLAEADSGWVVKTFLRSVATVFSLLGFSLFAAAIPIWNHDFYWDEGPNKGDWEDGFPLGVLVFTFIWNIVFLVLLVGMHKRMRPWIPVFIDFLTWIVLIPAIAETSRLGMYQDWGIPRYEYIQPHIYDVVHRVGKLELGGLVFACFVWILHLVLFCVGLRDALKWRKMGRSASPSSARGLEHGDFARDHQDPHVSYPPRYEEDAHGIEMNPTSPTQKEFV